MDLTILMLFKIPAIDKLEQELEQAYIKRFEKLKKIYSAFLHDELEESNQNLDPSG